MSSERARLQEILSARRPPLLVATPEPAKDLRRARRACGGSMVIRILASAAFILLTTATRTRAQNANVNAAGAESEEDRLAREVNDPTAILTQLKFQDLYTPRNFQTTAQTNTVQMRPVIPIEAFALFPFQQIIRPTFRIVTVATSRGSATDTEVGDMTLFDLVVSNWPNPRTTAFGWAIGPTFVFPTGRTPEAGKHAWKIGPAAAAVYRGIPHLMVGFLFQNPISFAYTNSSATPQSEIEFQPLVSYALGRGWYVKSADMGRQLASRQLDEDSGQLRWRTRMEDRGSGARYLGIRRMDCLQAVRQHNTNVYRALRPDAAVSQFSALSARLVEAPAVAVTRE